MIYEVRLSDQVKLDLVRLAKSEPKAFAKANRFIEELKEHRLVLQLLRPSSSVSRSLYASLLLLF